MPHLLDPGDLGAAPFAERELRKPHRDADPQAAGDQLQQGPTAGAIERVEPRRQMRPDLGAVRLAQRRHDLAQRRNRRGVGMGAGLGPDQRHRFGEVADKIIGPAEQLGIDAAHRQGAHLAGLGFGEAEFAGQSRQSPAALRIGRRREILAHQAQLAVARRGEQQGVNQRGEAVHACASIAPFASTCYVLAGEFGRVS